MDCSQTQSIRLRIFKCIHGQKGSRSGVDQLTFIFKILEIKMYLQINNLKKDFISSMMDPLSARSLGGSSLRSVVFLDITLFQWNWDEHHCVFLHKCVSLALITPGASPEKLLTSAWCEWRQSGWFIRHPNVVSRKYEPFQPWVWLSWRLMAIPWCLDLAPFGA